MFGLFVRLIVFLLVLFVVNDVVLFVRVGRLLMMMVVIRRRTRLTRRRVLETLSGLCGVRVIRRVVVLFDFRGRLMVLDRDLRVRLFCMCCVRLSVWLIGGLVARWLGRLRLLRISFLLCMLFVVFVMALCRILMLRVR